MSRNPGRPPISKTQPRSFAKVSLEPSPLTSSQSGHQLMPLQMTLGSAAIIMDFEAILHCLENSPSVRNKRGTEGRGRRRKGEKEKEEEAKEEEAREEEGGREEERRGGRRQEGGVLVNSRFQRMGPRMPKWERKIPLPPSAYPTTPSL